ncbi:hypothetical protein PCE1_002169 [Barthelona sp. PCE]
MEPIAIKHLIGYSGYVPKSTIAHPDQTHLIYPVGANIIIKNTITNEIKMLKGHDNEISCMALSKTGTLIASGQKTHIGFTADVIIWDFETGTEITRLSLHKGDVKSIAFSHNDEFIATVGGRDDLYCAVWDLNTYQAIAGNSVGGELMRGITFFNEDCHKFLTYGNKRIIHWSFDKNNHKLRGEAVQLGSNVRDYLCCYLDAADRYLYLGTRTGDLFKVNVETKVLSSTAIQKAKLAKGITSIHHIDGKLVIGSGAGEISVVNMQTNKRIASKTLNVYGGVHNILQLGNKIIVGTSIGNIYTLPVQYATTRMEFEPELTLTSNTTAISGIAFAPGFSDIFATSCAEQIRLCNLHTGAELIRIMVPNERCLCLTFTCDSSAIISGWSDGKIRAFGPKSGKLLWTINDAHEEVTAVCAGFNSGDLLLSGGSKGSVRVWRVSRHVQTFVAELKEHSGRITDLTLRSDELEAVSTSADGSCVVWDMTRLSRRITMLESTFFETVSYGATEGHIVCGTSDQRLIYYDAYNGSIIRELKVPTALTSLHFDHTEEDFVFGGTDSNVYVIDYDSADIKYVGSAHSEGINVVRFTPNGKYIVSGGNDGAVIVWKL